MDRCRLRYNQCTSTSRFKNSTMPTPFIQVDRLWVNTDMHENVQFVSDYKLSWAFNQPWLWPEWSFSNNILILNDVDGTNHLHRLVFCLIKWQYYYIFGINSATEQSSTRNYNLDESGECRFSSDTKKHKYSPFFVKKVNTTLSSIMHALSFFFF